MAKKKRSTVAATATRKSERTRKQTLKYEAFVKTMEQLGDSSTEEDVVLMKSTSKQANVETDDVSTVSMLNGVYKLVTDFNLDVCATKYGCFNTRDGEADGEGESEAETLLQSTGNHEDLDGNKSEIKCEVNKLKEEKEEMAKFITRLNSDLEKFEDLMYKK